MAAELLRGSPKPDGMMAGLTADIDAVLFIGYHGKAGTPRSVLAHTISGGVIADVRCNDLSLGELGLNSAPAAHHGVPPVLVSGDDTVAAEAAQVAPGCVPSWSSAPWAPALLHPDEACDRLEREVPQAPADREPELSPPAGAGHQPRARHSGMEDRSLPSVVSLPCPG